MWEVNAGKGAGAEVIRTMSYREREREIEISKVHSEETQSGGSTIPDS